MQLCVVRVYDCRYYTFSSVTVAVAVCVFVCSMAARTFAVRIVQRVAWFIAISLVHV